MKRIIHIVGFAFALLLLFLVTVVFTTGWLRRQNDRLQVALVVGGDEVDSVAVEIRQQFGSLGVDTGRRSISSVGQRSFSRRM